MNMQLQQVVHSISNRTDRDLYLKRQDLSLLPSMSQPSIAHPALLVVFLYKLNVFYTLGYIQTAVWKPHRRKFCKTVWRCVIEDPVYPTDGYHWGVDSTISRSIVPWTLEPIHHTFLDSAALSAIPSNA